MSAFTFSALICLINIILAAASMILRKQFNEVLADYYKASAVVDRLRRVIVKEHGLAEYNRLLDLAGFVYTSEDLRANNG